MLYMMWIQLHFENFLKCLCQVRVQAHPNMSQFIIAAQVYNYNVLSKGKKKQLQLLLLLVMPAS